VGEESTAPAVGMQGAQGVGGGQRVSTWQGVPAHRRGLRRRRAQWGWVWEHPKKQVRGMAPAIGPKKPLRTQGRRQGGCQPGMLQGARSRALLERSPLVWLGDASWSAQ